jgi:hypothetical protein
MQPLEAACLHPSGRASEISREKIGGGAHRQHRRIDRAFMAPHPPFLPRAAANHQDDPGTRRIDLLHVRKIFQMARFSKAVRLNPGDLKARIPALELADETGACFECTPKDVYRDIFTFRLFTDLQREVCAAGTIREPCFVK